MYFKKRLATLLFFILIAGSLFLSCQRTDFQTPENHRPMLQGKVTFTGDYVMGTGPCTGVRPYQISYELLDSAEFYGHDLAVRVLEGPPVDMDSCLCDSLAYCVTLSFPINHVELAGFKKDSIPFQTVIAVKDSLGGYENFTDPRIPDGTPTYDKHVICGVQDSTQLVFFDLNPGFPVGYNISDAIIEIEGICIVANVEDTGGLNADHIYREDSL